MKPWVMKPWVRQGFWPEPNPTRTAKVSHGIHDAVMVTKRRNHHVWAERRGLCTLPHINTQNCHR